LVCVRVFQKWNSISTLHNETLVQPPHAFMEWIHRSCIMSHIRMRSCVIQTNEKRVFVICFRLKYSGQSVCETVYMYRERQCDTTRAFFSILRSFFNVHSIGRINNIFTFSLISIIYFIKTCFTNTFFILFSLLYMPIQVCMLPFNCLCYIWN